MHRTPLALILLLLMLAPLSLRAVEGDSPRQLRHNGFYLAPGFAMVSKPLFRQPSGNSEASIPQKNNSIFFAGGWERSVNSILLGVRLAYWDNTYNDFSYPEMPNSPYPVYVQYSNPKKTYMTGDIIVGWIPDKAGLFAVYGLLGLGLNHETYTLVGSTFSEWDGSQSYSEFFYSYGLGVKVTPVRPLSLYAELRLIPGASSLKLKYDHSDETYDYYRYLGSYTSNYTTAFTVGLMINI